MRFNGNNPLFLSCCEISYLARPLEPIETQNMLIYLLIAIAHFCSTDLQFVLKGIDFIYFQKFL